MEDKKYIPKYLNAQPQILWWDLSEFIVFLIILFIGILGNFPFFASLVGVVILKITTKAYKKKEPGYFKHLMYSYGVFGMKNKVPDFWIKEIGK